MYWLGFPKSERVLIMPLIDLTETSCWCGLPFAMPTSLYKICKNDGTRFYCPLGHRIVFKETQADKYRRERDRLQQQLAYVSDERDAAERREAAQKGQVTKLKKRANAGVCPCCNRTFQNLHRHMKTKHPGFGDNNG